MKIIVLGNGFIASHLKYERINFRFSPNDRVIQNFLNNHEPDVIINTMGYAGVKNIDDCEINKDKTIESNLLIPTILAQNCNKLGIKFITIGSGCIYLGRSPHEISDYSKCSKDCLNYDHWLDTGWQETDAANPGSFYAKTKYACDLAISSLPNVTILRIRMPISHIHSSRNLINKLLKYDHVLETVNSVTFMDDLVKVIDWSIEHDKNGIYHVTNSAPITHIQLLEEYRKYHPEHSYIKINEQELQNFITAPRSNCILNTNKLTSEGFQMQPTLEALANTVKRYVQNN